MIRSTLGPGNSPRRTGITELELVTSCLSLPPQSSLLLPRFVFVLCSPLPTSAPPLRHRREVEHLVALRGRLEHDRAIRIEERPPEVGPRALRSVARDRLGRAAVRREHGLVVGLRLDLQLGEQLGVLVGDIADLVGVLVELEEAALKAIVEDLLWAQPELAKARGGRRVGVLWGWGLGGMADERGEAMSGGGLMGGPMCVISARWYKVQEAILAPTT